SPADAESASTRNRPSAPSRDLRTPPTNETKSGSFSSLRIQAIQVALGKRIGGFTVLASHDDVTIFVLQFFHLGAREGFQRRLDPIGRAAAMHMQGARLMQLQLFGMIKPMKQVRGGQIEIEQFALFGAGKQDRGA